MLNFKILRKDTSGGTFPPETSCICAYAVLTVRQQQCKKICVVKKSFKKCARALDRHFETHNSRWYSDAVVYIHVNTHCTIVFSISICFKEHWCIGSTGVPESSGPGSTPGCSSIFIISVVYRPARKPPKLEDRVRFPAEIHGSLAKRQGVGLVNRRSRVRISQEPFAEMYKQATALLVQRQALGTTNS